jgi:hypothetical protein
MRVILLFLSLALAMRTPMGGARIKRRAPAAAAAAAKPFSPRSPGVFGLDVSDNNIDGSAWSCMHTQGNYTFAVIEGWRGGYQLSPVAGSVANAWNAGFSHVDVYAFMCNQCNNGPQSARALVNYLSTNNVRYGMIWLDVEQCSGCWSSDLASNCAFVQSLASTYVALGVRIGVYASHYEWSVTVGSGCDMSQYPLWYPDYDYNPSFSGFQPFAGWTSPAIKQFSDSASNACGQSIDRDWYP